MRGFIQLIDFEDNVIRYGSYSYRKGRQDIIDMWKREYANRLDGCAIHITPDDSFCEQRASEENGVNCRKDFKERTPQIKKENYGIQKRLPKKAPTINY